MFPHLNPTQKTALNTIVRELKANFPTAHPVHIRTLDKLPGYYGKAEFKGGKKPYFLITLRRDKWETILDTLIHEFSHVLSWKLIYNEKEIETFHDESWSLEFGKLYRWLHEERDNFKDVAGKCNFKPQS